MSRAFHCDGPCDKLYAGRSAQTFEQTKGIVPSDRAAEFELCRDCAEDLAAFLEGDPDE